MDRLQRALMHLSLYVAVNGDAWVKNQALAYLGGAEPPTAEAMREVSDSATFQSIARETAGDDARDAARYRWLRERPQMMDSFIRGGAAHGEKLDEAIDSSRNARGDDRG